MDCKDCRDCRLIVTDPVVDPQVDHDAVEMRLVVAKFCRWHTLDRRFDSGPGLARQCADILYVHARNRLPQPATKAPTGTPECVQW